jgi:putative copper resistance protein D
MIELAWVVLRAATLVLVLQCAGAALFIRLFARTLTHSAPIRRAGARAAALVLALLLVQYLFEPVHLAGQWGGLADPMLYRMALSSSAGTALMVRFLGVAGLAAGLSRDGPVSGAVALTGSLVALSSFLLTGHSTLDAHRWLLAPLLLVHLLIVAFWFGSLAPLRTLTALEPPAEVARAARAFSALAMWLVPVIPLAGVCMALVLLPDAAALLRPYGMLLIGKLALFTALMGLAAYNRLQLVPALARADPAARSRFRRSLAAEYGLICAALAVTAVLTGFFSPAADD